MFGPWCECYNENVNYNLANPGLCNGYPFVVVTNPLLLVLLSSFQCESSSTHYEGTPMANIFYSKDHNLLHSVAKLGNFY